MRSVWLVVLWTGEVVGMLTLVWVMAQALPWFGGLLRLFSYGLAFRLMRSSQEPAFKIAWLWLLLPFPLVGGCLYLLLRGRSEKKRIAVMQQRIAEELMGFGFDGMVPSLPYQEDGAPQIYYLEQELHCAGFEGCEAVYLSSGEVLFGAMLEELGKAKRYILIEYFLINEGVFWQELLHILEKKVEAGVDVRVIYDDAGCFFKLGQNFSQQLMELGIQVQVFHPLGGLFSRRCNQRNHRKIMVIDGITAFTGGVNLSDEYINRKERFGYWKDSGVRVTGAAVWAMTVLFLSMWEYCGGKIEKYSSFFPENREFFQETSVVLPYNSIPVDSEAEGQRVLLNLITRAKRYIHITSPYLILDTATQTALCNAAKSGIEVVIITPHIPDKKLVFQVTRAFYGVLMEAGVHIYEFTPGFIHEKNVVVDGVFGTIGTVNLDFRSLFLQFENGLWLWNSPCLEEMERDFQQTRSLSQGYEAEKCNVILGVVRSILRLLSPLM